MREDDACFKCNLPGHQSKNCPSGVNVCYRCKREGHIAKNCPETDERIREIDSDGAGSQKCFKCENLGHIAKNCPYTHSSTGEPLKEMLCYNCNEEGHKAKNCKKAEVRNDNKPSIRPSSGPSREGDKFGDIVKNAVLLSLQNRGLHKLDVEDIALACSETTAQFFKSRVEVSPRSGEKCFKCNQIGHWAKDCPLVAREKCYTCGREGHRAKECKNRSRERSRTPERILREDKGCFRCGKPGHIGKMCPHSEDVCFSCRREGHKSFDCPERKGR